MVWRTPWMGRQLPPTHEPWDGADDSLAQSFIEKQTSMTVKIGGREVGGGTDHVVSNKNKQAVVIVSMYFISSCVSSYG